MIPYFIMMTLAGLPTFYLEMAIGQFSSQTPHLLYLRMSPLFAGTHLDHIFHCISIIINYYYNTGIGYTMVLISALTAIYYNVIIAWAIRYMVASFTSHLPFVGCHH